MSGIAFDCRLTLEICAGERAAALAAAARRFAWQQERHRRQIDTVRELVAAFSRLEAQHRAEREHSEHQLLFWRDAALRDALCGTLNRRGLQAATTRPPRGCRARPSPSSLSTSTASRPSTTRTARCVQEALRQGDLLARLGGEEFCVVLEACPAAEARSVAAKLCAAVAGQDWPAVAPGLAVTISCGVSAGSSGLDALLAAADQQLYRAKADGRNCVR